MLADGLLLCLMEFAMAINGWEIEVLYSASAKEDFAPLGSIAVERAFDGNYTASFQFSGSSNTWRSQLLNAAQNGWPYRVRADGGAVQGYNEPCLMLRAKGAHHFRLSVDLDRQSLQSLTVFPENLFSLGPDYRTCDAESFSRDITIRGSATVNTIQELPLPDTVSYIQKMEKERQARQHGAQQDNRSFIQKYWMYIAAAVVFMIISNAAAAEQGGD